MSRIRLSKKQAEVWRLLDRPEKAEVFAGGGAGGGKSWLGCLRQIYRRTTFSDTRGFIGRRDFTALRDSTMKTYFDLLRTMGYQSEVHYRYNAQEHIVYFENGSEQHFRHMSYQPSDPDYNRFGSTEYTDAFIDEAPEVDKRAAEIIFSRLRLNHAKHGITKELLLTGNPTDNWIKYRYVMDEQNNFIDLPKHRARVLFTISDNPDTELRESYTQTLELLDDYDRARLLYGDWTARPNIERPFAFQYDQKRHRQPCELNPSRQIYISFDFNIDPFAVTFIHIWEDRDNFHFHVFDELSIDGGNLPEGVVRIKAKYNHLRHNFIITGDYNGNVRSMQSATHETNYLMLQRLLFLSPSQMQVNPNPRHENSRSDFNFLLAHADFRVSENCVNSERDLRLVEVDEKQSIVKKNRGSDAQRADHLDTLRYAANLRVVKEWMARKQLTMKVRG